MVAEDERERRHHQADLLVLEVAAGPRAERRDALARQRVEVAAAVLPADRVEQERDLAVVLDDPLLLEVRDHVREAARLVPAAGAVDREDGRVARVHRARLGHDRLREPEVRALRVRPVGAGHPAVVGLDDPLVRAVVDREGLLGARLEAGRELEDVADRRPAEPIERLVLVADDRDVHLRPGKTQDELLLDEVRVLVLVDHGVLDPAGDRLADVGLLEELQELRLEVGEVDRVGQRGAARHRRRRRDRPRP